MKYKMKTVLSVFFITLLFIGNNLGCKATDHDPSAPNFDRKAEPLKIVCYNILFGSRSSLDDISAFFKEQNADIVALQEVDVNTNRPEAVHHNGKHFITVLGYHSGMLTAYARTIYYSGGYYGIGILSQ